MQFNEVIIYEYVEFNPEVFSEDEIGMIQAIDVLIKMTGNPIVIIKDLTFDWCKNQRLMFN